MTCVCLCSGASWLSPIIFIRLADHCAINDHGGVCILIFFHTAKERIWTRAEKKQSSSNF